MVPHRIRNVLESLIAHWRAAQRRPHLLMLEPLERRETPAVADIVVTNSDGYAEVADGSGFTGTIRVTNLGPDAVSNVAIADDFPSAPPVFVSWSAVASGGASVALTSGIGDIATSAILTVGGSVTFTLNCSTNVRVHGTFTHTATATLASGDTDPNPANNSATDSTVISTRFVRDAAGSLLAVGSDVGVPGHVKVYDANGQLRYSFLPFGPGFFGGVRVATARVNVDTTDDIIVGAGQSAPGGHVKVFDGATGAELMSFVAFPGFIGGVTVAGGDTDRDGRGDVIVGAGSGAPGGHVKVFSGATGAELKSFFAFPGFAGGVTVAAPAVATPGVIGIVVGAGSGAPGGHVKVFDGPTGAELRSFFAFPGFPGGVTVAGGGSGDVFVGTASLTSHVKVFSVETAKEVLSFLTFPGFSGGVRVDAIDRNADAVPDIVAGAGPGGGPHVKVFDRQTLGLLDSFFAFDPLFSGGVFVG